MVAAAAVVPDNHELLQWEMRGQQPGLGRTNPGRTLSRGRSDNHECSEDAQVQGDSGHRNGQDIGKGPIDLLSEESVRGFAVRWLDCAKENQQAGARREPDSYVKADPSGVIKTPHIGSWEKDRL